ncbi:MAG: dimethylarginine dimethylaminohydrolase family protein [Candidatus Bathyarchaeia archaeon]
MRETIQEHKKRLAQIYRRLHPPLKTRFEDEVEKYWGREWKANTEIGRLRMVLLHRPGEEINSIQPPLERWRYTEKPDLGEMVDDYERLAKVFREEGVEVLDRRPETNRPPRLVKSIYTRDPSFAAVRGTIVGRMYDALRRGEELFTYQTYAGIGCPVVGIVHGKGVIEGGSVMWLDEKHLAIGLSFRVNEEGARQVAEIVKAQDPEVDVKAVPIMGGHIDAHICMVDKHKAVVNRDALPYSFTEYLKEELRMEIIDRPQDVYVDGVAIKPGRVVSSDGVGWEEGRRLMERAGVDVIPVRVDTLVHPRNSGSIHCLTMPIIREPEPQS